MSLEGTVTQAFDLVLREPSPIMLLFQEKDGDKLVPIDSDFLEFLVMAGGIGKDIMSATIKKVCALVKPFAYVIIMEAWYLDGTMIPEGEAERIYNEGKSIAEHPARKECVQIIVGGQDRTIARAWDILRNESGDRYGLAKIHAMDNDDGKGVFTGRFADLNIQQHAKH